MKIYMMTDLEGVAGVLDSENWCLPQSRYYAAACALLTAEVNAAVDGLVSAGADEVLVVDGHGAGGLEPAGLHPAACLARNWPGGKPYPFNMAPGMAAAVWVGQHPKAGTVGGHLCHTGTMAVRDAAINGVSIGEFGEGVFNAGELGIPVIFASGCEAFCAEARALVPGIETVAVKRGIQTEAGHHLPEAAYRRHNTGAVHLSPETARTRIRDGARRALERFRTSASEPVTLAAPYELVTVWRSDEIQPPRRGVKRHPSSVIGLLNAPWESCIPLPYDPLDMAERTLNEERA